MKSPEVTLVIPTQGRRPSLAAALDSALAQDFAALEILVVDDAGEGDDWRREPALARALADPRVRLVPFNQGRGCAAAKNAGWRAARGRWLCYLDDDNTYEPGKISAQHACAQATGSPVVLCGYTVLASGRRRRRQTDRSGYAGDELLLEANPDTNVLFHRRDAPLQWDEDLGTVDDACLFQALVRHYALKHVPNVPQPLVSYTAHGGPRANLGFLRFYRGQRRLLVRWSRDYSRGARRLLLRRSLVACARFSSGGWARLGRNAWRLLAEGGLKEWRTVANAVGVKTPFLRRFMVT